MWKGFLSFGLVTIPVQLYSAVESREELHFNLLHKKDDGKIRYQRVCEVDGEAVEWADVVKGWKTPDGGYVEVTDEDFEKADVARSSTIDIQDFCAAAEIEPSYFDRPLFIAPQKGGEKPYALLREALKERGRVGVAKVVLRQREQLCCVRPVGDALELEILRFADEVRDPGELDLPGAKGVPARELALAGRLVDEMTAPFDIKQYKDEYKAKLRAIIDEKVAGKEPAPRGEAPKATRVTDLMKVLERSLATRGDGKNGKASTRTRTRTRTTKKKKAA
jgi:DNA end-binding protein Ku